MKPIERLMRRAWPAPFVGLALGLTAVPGCSGSGTPDVASVNPYSVLPAEEVDKTKATFLKKMYPETPPPKAPGVKVGRAPKAGKPAP